MYQNTSGEWVTEAISFPFDPLLVLPGACTSYVSGEVTFLICGIGQNLFIMTSDAPTRARSVSLIGSNFGDSPTNPYFGYAAVSTGGTSIALLATYGRARYVVMGPIAYGRGTIMTSTWVPIRANGACLSLDRRTTATSDELIVGCTGLVNVIPLGTSSPVATYYPVGTGIYYTMSYSSVDDFIYLGSSVGIGFQVTAATMKVSRIFFLPGGNRATFTSIVVDSHASAPNIYWATFDGGIYRTTPTDFTTIDSIDLSATTFPNRNLKIARMIATPGSTTQMLVTAVTTPDYYTGDQENTAVLISVRKTDCTGLACGKCVQDSYCSYCYSSGSCVSSDICLPAETANTTAQCPAISSTSPTRISVTGGNYWTAYLTGLKGGLNASDYRCVYTISNSSFSATKTVVAQAIDSSAATVSCMTPQFSSNLYAASNVTYTGTAYIAIPGASSGSLVPWTPKTKKATFYNCYPRLAGCIRADLFDCGWCFSNGLCTAPNDTFCPATDSSLKDVSSGYRPYALTQVTAITPSLLSVAYTGQIVVNVSDFPAFADSSKQMLCVSNGNRTSIATPTIDPKNPNFYQSFSCPMPTNIAQPTTLAPRTLAFSIYTGSTRQIQLNANLASISVFNCALRTNCLSCLDPSLNNGCTWCSTDRKCYDPGLAPSSSSCSQNNATCPVITRIEPAVATLTTFNSDALSIALTGQGFSSVSPLSCSWNLPTFGTFSSTATIINDTHATCLSHGPVSHPAVWNFGLNVSASVALAPPSPFNIYDCNAFTTCGDCVSYPGIQCHWCNSPGQSLCTDSASSSSCPSLSVITPSNATSCPQIVSTDPFSFIIGLSASTTLTLAGSEMNFNDEASVVLNLRCGLTAYDATGTASSSEVLYTPQYDNSESVICPAMAIPNAPFSMIRLLDTVTNRSSVAAFNVSVVDCTTYSDCPSCIEARCMLCGGACAGSCNSTDTKQLQCPEYAGVSPNYSELSGQTKIYVTASNLLATYSSLSDGSTTSGGSSLRSYESHVDEELIITRDSIKRELSTLTWTRSRDRISHLLKQLEAVEYEIQVSVNRLFEPSTADIFGIGASQGEGADRGGLQRSVQALPTLPYTCSWDDDQVTSAQYSAPNTIICTSPTSGIARNVSLSIYLGDYPYLTVPSLFELISCPSATSTSDDGSATCNPACMADQSDSDQRCGWCALSGTCTSPALCPIPTDIWQPSCSTIELSELGSNYAGGRPLIVNMSTPLPAYVDLRNLTCAFGADVYAPATINTQENSTQDITSVSCLVPRSPVSDDSTRTVTVAVSVQYLARSVTSSAAFSYVNCKAFTKCTDCTTRALCGWCSTNSKCTMDYECSADDWTRDKCPLNVLALGLGLALGLLALILLVGLLVFLLVRAHRRRTGLVIAMVEPNYDAIAWGNDIRLAYRLPKSQWGALERALQRNDFILQLGLSFNCPPTEQDSLAKGLVYVACAHGVATEMIKAIINAEVQACSLENQLFRSNSVASKMYKFYSRIVGVKYLYHCIARMVMELEVLGNRAMAAAGNNGKNASTNSGSQKGSGSGTVSILDVSLELDATKDGGRDDDVDAETNRLQLQLICQKILTVISKKTLRNIPKPLREIFVEIDRSVSSKFPGSNEAIYKGLGGLFFLRFVCPALTAPHVYGLLQAPPNDSTQRQLVLIAKVIQSIANMQTQTQKEEYMEKMSLFINKSIPRIQRFYDNLREASNITVETSIYERVIFVPDEVRQNGLAATQAVLVPQAPKIKAWDSTAVMGEIQKAELNTIIDECLTEESHVPKKSKPV